MKSYYYVLLALGGIFFSSCFKDPPSEPFYYPWECHMDVTRNGEKITLTDGRFFFTNQTNYYENPYGDSLIGISFRCYINKPHYENFSFRLIPDIDFIFTVEYDLLEQQQDRFAFLFSFKEADTTIGEFNLDTSYHNILKIESVSEDKKIITGSLDFRVIISEKDKTLPGQWAPDTITYSNGNFIIKSLE